jgi:hypothetical protein
MSFGEILVKRIKERGSMPGIQPIIKRTGPGDILSSAILKLTGREISMCGICGLRRTAMNEWGWWSCWRHRNEIAGWLVEEARKRGHTVTQGAAVDLLRAAFKELRLRNKLQSSR